MKPRTLEETIPALDAMLSEDDRKLIQEATTAEEVYKLIVAAHHGLGQTLRNEWGLWHGSELAQDLKKNHGVDHPDDMSHFILDHYSRVRIRTRAQRILGVES
jgi:hypothetical protein